MIFEIEERVQRWPPAWGLWRGFYTLKINDRHWWEYELVFGDERPSVEEIERARSEACVVFGKVKPLRRAPITKAFYFSGNVQMGFETVRA